MKQSTLNQIKKLTLEFKPHPLARNRHFQTIFSSYPKFNAKNLGLHSREMILTTDEGVRLQGFFTPQPAATARGVVLLLHGWLGCATSNYVGAVGETLFEAGYSIFRLNFRDHGDTAHLNPGTFRSDRLDEVFSAARQVAYLEPHGPLHIIGVSLGGSFAVRVAWQHSRQPIPNMGHTIGICPLIDPLHSTLVLDDSPIYLRYFRRNWRRSFKAKQAAFPDLYDFSAEIAAPTCMEMTEAFMRNNGPYPNARTYFEHYAITPAMMAELSSPVTMLTAADDPVIPVTNFAQFEGVSPWLDVNIQPYGGHVGFVDIFPFRYWINDALREILKYDE